jgi:hypothetical protein
VQDLLLCAKDLFVAAKPARCRPRNAGEPARSGRSADRFPEARFPNRPLPNAGQNVDEGRYSVSADEFAGALDQQNPSEEKEKWAQIRIGALTTRQRMNKRGIE